MTMIKVTTIAILLISSISAKADGLFMGINWAGGAVATSHDYFPRSRSEETEGVTAGKIQKVSVQPQVAINNYNGRSTFDGICNQAVSEWGGESAWYKDTQETNVLFTSGQGSCTSVAYPGYRMGSQGMMLAAPYNGGFPFVSWRDVTYNLLDSRWGGN